MLDKATTEKMPTRRMIDKENKEGVFTVFTSRMLPISSSPIRLSAQMAFQ